MTRPYALCRLLEHGALTWGQLREITGWPHPWLASVLTQCLEAERIEKTGEKRAYVYRLA